MLSVFVCEDDTRYKKIISDCIQKYICKKEFDMELALCTSNPEKLIHHIKSAKVKGLYFLDIELQGGYNGVEFAKNIRQYDPRAFISFITSHPRYMSLTFEYKVEALAYIQKEDDATICKKIENCIDDAYRKHVTRSDDGCYIFTTPAGRQVSCTYDDILLFTTGTAGTKQLVMHTIKRQYVFYDSLDKISTTLPAGQFYRCHKSYIVNIGNITECGRKALDEGADKIIMPDGMDCLVASRKRKALLNLLNSL